MTMKGTREHWTQKHFWDRGLLFPRTTQEGTLPIGEDEADPEGRGAFRGDLPWEDPHGL